MFQLTMPLASVGCAAGHVSSRPRPPERGVASTHDRCATGLPAFVVVATTAMVIIAPTWTRAGEALICSTNGWSGAACVGASARLAVPVRAVAGACGAVAVGWDSVADAPSQRITPRDSAPVNKP